MRNLKRNDVFLFSYIAFIVICLFVRSWGEYGSWPAIVSAIAISSALLTCAEYFGIYANYFSRRSDADEEFVKSIRCRNLDARQEIIKLCDTLAKTNIEGLETSEDIKNFTQVSDGTIRFESFLDDYEKLISSYRNKQKAYNIVANTFRVAAFLAFLCIITFPVLAEGMYAAQDIVSVLAFLLILISQYVSSLYSNKLQIEGKQRNQTKSHLNKQMEEVINSCNKHFFKLHQLSDWQECLTEEDKHAD